jgi:DNA recombination protein RmuC
MLFTSLVAHLPWIIAMVVAVLLVSVLLWHARSLRRALDTEQHAHELTRFSHNSTNEKLDMAVGAIERSRNEFVAQRDNFSARIESLTSAASTATHSNSALEAKNAGLTAQLSRLSELSAQLELAQQRFDALSSEHSRLEVGFGALKMQAREQQQSALEKINLLEQAESRLSKEFENLANRIFEEKQRKFNDSSKTGVESLLRPVREQLADFRKKVEDIYDSENKDRASLRAEISQLKGLNERISNDALNLTNALKGDSKVRGNWGEVQLERVLEQSGLEKGREYEIQASFRSESGQRFQPDVVVHLPDRKDVIIDSKVSLVAYEQVHASDDDGVRKRHIDAHIASLRAHIDGLSAKSYDELIGLNSLDLVIMFVPIEPALLLALEQQPQLIEEALNKSVLLVCPSTLMGTLRIIHNIWRYEHQNRNTQAIASQAGSLYDAFVNFVESLDKVGQALDRAQGEFETAHKRLTSGRGNLIARSEKLKRLGIKIKKPLPEQLIETDSAYESEDDVA